VLSVSSANNESEQVDRRTAHFALSLPLGRSSRNSCLCMGALLQPTSPHFPNGLHEYSSKAPDNLNGVFTGGLRPPDPPKWSAFGLLD
jgi:hypothetical protein